MGDRRRYLGLYQQLCTAGEQIQRIGVGFDPHGPLDAMGRTDLADEDGRRWR
jgi:hypothetical protein